MIRGAMAKACDLLVVNASEVVTLRGPAPRVGSALEDVGAIENGAVAIDGEVVTAVGPEADLRRRFAPRATLDAEKGTVLPGFVDAHTHPVFAKTRELEADWRQRGKTYQEITAAGGGIFSSVRALRAASTEELSRGVRERFDRLLASGTTTIEAKSGYGLNRDDEIRSLEILRDVAAEHPLDVVPTFLGAHQVPEEFRDRRDAYLDLLVHEVMPEVLQMGLASACDVFCDDGAYTLDEARRFLVAARDLGFSLRVHADELKGLGATELAVELGAASADHLCRVGDEGIKALKAGRTTAVLLPGTVLSLGAKALPPARRLIEENVPVAVATDLNPGTSFVHSMPFAIGVAVTLLRMTVAEALAGATVNAAWSLGLADRIGSIEEGKRADLVLLDRPSHLFLGYELGGNPVSVVVKDGKVVHRRAPLVIDT
jgi:imidazolonepropionase